MHAITRSMPAGQWGRRRRFNIPLEPVSWIQPAKIRVFATSILPTFRCRPDHSDPRFTQIPVPDTRGTFFYFLSTSCPARFKVSERSIDSTHPNALLKELSELDGQTHRTADTRKSVSQVSGPHFRTCAYGAINFIVELQEAEE